jgi:PTS system mannose-specific IIA component
MGARTNITMTTGLLIIAHAPLASALRACVLHVYPEAAQAVAAYDVPANEAPEVSLANVQQQARALATPRILVLTDVFGATPSNIAQKLVDGVRARLVAGVNLPMLLRTVNYREEELDVLVNRAIAGGTQCIMQVAVTAPQNQIKKHHDPTHHDHHQ